MEIVGEFLGLATDKALYRYFRRHYGEWFPALRFSSIAPPSLGAGCLSLWKVKERLSGKSFSPSLLMTQPSPSATLFALASVSVLARAYRCSRFHGEAAFGKDTLIKQTFYGFRVHVRVCWPGLISRFSVAPANVHDLSVLPELVERTWGVVVGDRNYHSSVVREELAERGVELAAPYRTKSVTPCPKEAPC